MAKKKFSKNTTIPQRVLIVDDDASVLLLMQKIISDLGVDDARMSSDGQEAWSLLESESFDAIVLDWQLPSVSGLALYNRIRESTKYRDTGVVVVSGFLAKDDFKVVRESASSELVEKPLQQPVFEDAFIQTVERSQWTIENQKTIAGLIQDLSIEPESALKEIRRLGASSPSPSLMYADAARILRQAKKYIDAERLIREGLVKEQGNLRLMTELAKVLYADGRFSEAASMLKVANGISPTNIGRLHLLGEIKLSELKPDEAHKAFMQALELDPKSEKAHAGVISAKNLEAYLQDPSINHVTQSIGSLLNVIAISLVRRGKIGSGIEQYHAALTYVSEAPLVARLYFNLGLAYMRKGEDTEAVQWFKKSKDMGVSDFDKATNYIEAIEAKGKSDDLKQKSSAGPAAPAIQKNSRVDFMEETVMPAASTPKSSGTPTEAPAPKKGVSYI